MKLYDKNNGKITGIALFLVLILLLIVKIILSWGTFERRTAVLL